MMNAMDPIESSGAGASADKSARLGRKLTLLSRYVEVTEQMKGCLSRGDWKGVDGRLSERQDLIERIRRLDLPKKNTGPGAEPCLRKIKEVLEAAHALDRELRKLLEVESENLRNELLNMSKVRRAEKGYGRVGVQTPRFLDTRR